MNHAPSADPKPSRPKVRWLLRGLLLVALAAGLAWFGHYRYWRQNLRRFEVVRPGVLYRSGQPSRRGMQNLVEDYGLKTILCLRREEPRLRLGMFFEIGEPGGGEEGEEAAALGVRYQRWPLGNEVYWPWLTGPQLEKFYRLFDDPSNFPVLIHCAEGRHRTGTFVALFRMEYDRWDAERALAEMYSFDFGPPRLIQEHNLRTYLPRPLPEPDDWAELRSGFRGVFPEGPPADYRELAGRLRAGKDRPDVQTALDAYLAAERPFALCLAEWLIDAPDDPLAPVAAEAAGRCFDRSEAELRDWAAAAALIADFGTPAQQQQLLALLEAEPGAGAVTPRYRAVVSGVTNRYRRNRIAYLRPLLDDHRRRPERAAANYRYADTAVARLTSILDQNFLDHAKQFDRPVWDRAAEAAQKWFTEHPERARPGPLGADAGNGSVRGGS